MNYMEQVAKMLGVEFGERFKIDFNDLLTNSDYYDNDYYFSDSGLKNDNHSIAPMDVSILYNLICGKCFIKRKPWKPNEGDNFWFVDTDEVVCRYCVFNSQDADYVNYYKLGNCYRTKEEAEANLDRWIAFYESDEVLEV